MEGWKGREGGDMKVRVNDGRKKLGKGWEVWDVLSILSSGGTYVYGG